MSQNAKIAFNFLLDFSNLQFTCIHKHKKGTRWHSNGEQNIIKKEAMNVIKAPFISTKPVYVHGDFGISFRH